MKPVISFRLLRKNMFRSLVLSSAGPNRIPAIGGAQPRSRSARRCNPALTNFTLTKMMWVREHEPQNWARVRKVMLPKDYVRLRLSGESAIDVADASGTLMLDVAKRKWAGEVLEKTAIDPGILPKLCESPEVCGRISAEGAKESGLAIGTPLVAGAGDQAAGAVGIGINRPGTVSATIGT